MKYERIQRVVGEEGGDKSKWLMGIDRIDMT